MTVKEFYDSCGGGYEEMMAKFHNEKIISTFLKMLERDKNFDELCAKMDEGDAEGAFSAVHNLKGLILNLCLLGMVAPVNAVTEALRARDLEEAREHMPELIAAFTPVKEGLASLG